MGWRVLTISKSCHLKLEHKQLAYHPKEGETFTLPLEDIAVIILESHEVTLTNALLAAASEQGIAIFTCDSSHTPLALMLPFHQHSRYTEMALMQTTWTEPFKKRCWQEIIKAKIRNQATCLELCKQNGAPTLHAMSMHVQSGDSKNHEAQAAKFYWTQLFQNFNRQDSSIKNAALNYGYAILRGAIARNLVGYGFIPCFGLFHANMLNSFNLADDLIEPFRPFIDRRVFALSHEWDEEPSSLSLTMRQSLIAILTEECRIDGEILSLLNASEIAAQSLAVAVKNKDYHLLELPEFSTLQRRKNE